MRRSSLAPRAGAPGRGIAVLVAASVAGLAWYAICLLLGLPAAVALVAGALAFAAGVLALSVASARGEEEHLADAEPQAVEPAGADRWSREPRPVRTPDRAA